MILVKVNTICDIWFRVAIMDGWRIMYGSGWDTVDSFWTTSLEHIMTLMWWIRSITLNVDGLARTMVMRPVNETTQPDVIRRTKCHVQEWLATIKFWCSPNFSPVISDQYLFIFVKLEEDNICLFYNLPFGQAHRYVLTSLAIGKLVLV